MKKVAVLTGGYSEEVVISTKSADNIIQALKKNYETYLVFIEKDSWYVLIDDNKYHIDKNDFSFQLDGAKIEFDFVYNTIHGTPGENGMIQGYLDMINKPYSSSNHFASALTFNKWACNEFLKQQGILCSNSIYLRKGWKYDISLINEIIGFPCFVKPNEHGSSFGVSKVNKAEDLIPAIEKAFKGGNAVLIEAFVDGTEVGCGVIEVDGKLKALPLTEIVSDNEFFDFEAKYEGEAKEITPARISDELTNKVQEIAKNVYQITGLYGIARIDFIIMNDKPYLIEVNTTPGMSNASIIPQQIKAAGLDLSEVLQNIVEKG